VIGISLMLSWFLALTVTPMLGHYVFKRDHALDGDPYGGRLFQYYGRFLRVMLKLRWGVVVVLIAITAACVMGFAQVRQQFFPFSNTPVFYVHYQLPQGSAMAATRARPTATSWCAPRRSRRSPPFALSSKPSGRRRCPAAT
jgi:multidrug efflux pump subunit AcrB